MIKRAIFALFLIGTLGLAAIGCTENDTTLPDGGGDNNPGNNGNTNNGNTGDNADGDTRDIGGDTGDNDNDGDNADDFEQPPIGTSVGDTAPDFSLLNTNGEVISLEDLRGKALIINFWQTTCPPCVEEMPFFQQIHEQYSPDKVVFLGINIYETQSSVAEFMAENNLTLTMLLDGRASVAIDYDVMYTPTTFFIDGHGVIQAKKIGQFLGRSQIEQGIQLIAP